MPIDPTVAALCDKGEIEKADTSALREMADVLEIYDTHK